MRVFLDTNVLVSAFATRGLCADVLRVVLAEHELVTAETVLAELQRVLISKIGAPAALAKEIDSFLRAHHVEPAPRELPKVPVRDADDLLVLASALEARAEVLVTGDHDLLALAEEEAGLRIVDPRGFWSLVRRKTAR